MTTAIGERLAAVQAGLSLRDQDPLRFFHFAIPRLREAMAMLAEEGGIHELHARGPNKTGKTYCKAAWMLACIQKRKTLDGVRIPQWRGKVEGVQLVLDYPQQLLSVKPAYLKLLGRWPARVRMNGDYLASIHAMPVGGDPEDESDWGVIYFGSQKNPDTGRGWRSDVTDFDEPPCMAILREMRKAGHAGRKGLRIIGETPERRSEWAELQEDYGDTPRRCIRRVDRLKAEVRWSVSAFGYPDESGRWDDEVADWLLSAQEKQDMWDTYQGDPLFGKDGGARWHGDYEHTAGDSPWGDAGLRALVEMLKECRPPEIQGLRVQRERDEHPTTIHDNVPVQFWKPREEGKEYYIPIDPASGVEDRPTHQAGLHVREMGSGDLCARWAGHMAPWSLGVLAAVLAVRYNGAWVDIETNDHWGPTVARAVESPAGGNYHRLATEKKKLRYGVWSNEIGWRATEQSKRADIGEIQEWANSWAAGQRYALTPCREAISNILDCRLDGDGKVVVGPGESHGLDVVLQGRSLGRAVTRSGLAARVNQKPEQTDAERLIERIRGNGKAQRNGNGHRMVPKGKW